MAASVPHRYCSSDFCSSHTNISEETSLHNMYDSINHYNMMPLMSYDMNSPVSVASFPEQFGVVSDNFTVAAAVAPVPETEMGFRDFEVCDSYQHQLLDHGEDDHSSCAGLLPYFWQPCNPMPAQNWAIQEKAVTKVEEAEVKVGRYSVEEKKDRILRYLKKRNQRNFNKTIKYACRKTLADKRVRVRGRFAKNNEYSEEGTGTNTIDHDMVTSYQQNNPFYQDSFQIKYDEDDWLLQTSVANLVHWPYMLS